MLENFLKIVSILAIVVAGMVIWVIGSTMNQKDNFEQIQISEEDESRNRKIDNKTIKKCVLIIIASVLVWVFYEIF